MGKGKHEVKMYFNVCLSNAQAPRAKNTTLEFVQNGEPQPPKQLIAASSVAKGQIKQIVAQLGKGIQREHR